MVGLGLSKIEDNKEYFSKDIDEFIDKYYVGNIQVNSIYSQLKHTSI